MSDLVLAFKRPMDLGTLQRGADGLASHEQVSVSSPYGLAPGKPFAVKTAIAWSPI